jgi:carboxymethylenebutenolidase
LSDRYESISSADGGHFDAYCAVPQAGSGPGILLFQEIFGVNDNMRGVADRLAAEGFVVLVPDMFWRIEPRFERKDESGLGDAMGMVGRLDMGKVPLDIAATHTHLLGMEACTGKVGAVGFCLGGTLAFLAAATSSVDGRGIDAAVSYYGSGNNDLLGMVDQLSCPVMFHYGNMDMFIPEEKVAEVEAAIAGHPHLTLHRYDANHAFSNWDTPSMYDEAAATEAWARTLAFFHEHLD